MGLILSLDNTIGSFSASGSTFDADYQAVLDYGTTQGYVLPSASQQVLQNQLVVDLKAAGVWSKLDTFGVFATDGDSDFALIDWKRLTDYTAVNSPTFTADLGYTTDGVSSYINTIFALGSGGNYSLNDASGGVWVNNPVDTSGSTVFWGARGAVSTHQALGVTQNQVFINGGIGVVPLNTSAGLRHINRTSSGNVQRYVNGVEDAALATSIAVPNVSAYIGCLNSNGTAVAFEGNLFCIFFAGASLSAEASDFYTALNTYMTSI